jgi:periplasmic protein TonB
MNVALISALTILAAASFVPGPAAADCKPRVMESPTKYPLRSQQRGQSGTVLIDIRVNPDGRATSVDLRSSSGFRLLDRAAVKSVLNGWQFDVSSCQSRDLPTSHLVAVEFHNPQG